MTLPRIYDSAAAASLDFANNWRERSERAKAKLAAHKDPKLHLLRRIRAKAANLSGAVARANEDFRAEHAGIPSNIPGTVHPQVAELLQAFVAEHGLEGRDLTLPLTETGETLDAKTARYVAEVEAEHAAAVAQVAAQERADAQREIDMAHAKLASVEATYQDVPVVEADTIADLAAPRRGPGRPPKRLNVQDLSQILTADD